MPIFNGTSGNDSITGTADNDTILGLAGDDTLIGLAGNDSLSGGSGINFLHGGLGDDTLDGSAGGFEFADFSLALTGVTVDLSLVGPQVTGEGTDTLVSIEGLIGSAFNDTLTGDGNNNVLRAGTGGVDTIAGGGGLDAIDFLESATPVTVNLGDGTGRVDYAAGTVFYSSIEWARGSRFNDVLTGDAGDNRLRGWAGSDTIDGGAGFDTTDYSFFGTGLLVDLQAGTATGGGDTDVLTSIEAAIGSGFGDTLNGNGGENSLTGGAGGDVLRGGGGNDTLDGGANTNGTDYDFADYRDATGPVVGFTDLNASTPGQASGAGVGTDVLVDIEAFYGSAFADQFTGSGDDDFFQGGAGNDTLNGGAGFDFTDYAASPAGITADLRLATGQVQDGYGGVDTLIAIEGLLGSMNDDTVTGGAGNDFVRGRRGNDWLDGGAGNDSLDYNGASGSVFASLATGTSSGADGSDRFVNFETVSGGNFHDRLEGDDLANLLRGRNGNDTLLGGEGADTLRGDAGDDRFEGGDNFHYFDLDFVNYSNSGSAGMQVNLALGTATGEGNDTLVGIEAVLGSAGADSIVGGDALVEFFQGGAGNDTIDGGGGLGYDIADYGNAGGSVTVDLRLLGQAQNTGSAGVDLLIAIGSAYGSNSNDTLIGNAEKNVFRPRGGDDTVRGGDGIDAIDYRNASGAVTVDLALQGQSQNTGSDGNDWLESIERIFGSAFGDTLRGDDGENTIRGFQGDDLIDGRGGIDTASYTQAYGGVTVKLATQLAPAQQPTLAPTVAPGASSGIDGVDTLIDIENIIGGLHGDLLIGNEFANRLSGDDSEFGGAGDDTLYGGFGDDTLEGAGGFDIADYVDAPGAIQANLVAGTVTGAHGNDTLITMEAVAGGAFADTFVGTSDENGFRGNGGNDTIDGGGGSDWAAYDLAPSAVSVNLGIGTATGTATGGDGSDTLISIENVVGSEHGDTLAGNEADNIFEALGGNDTVTGAAGNDIFWAGEGNDSIDGGAGVDWILYEDASTGINVNLAAGTATGEGADTLAGIENVRGSWSADLLLGDAAANRLEGLDGNDSVTGGGGNDTLAGGAGNDVIDGGEGVDIAAWDGIAQSYALSFSSGRAIVNGGDGDDIVANVERLQFTDKTVIVERGTPTQSYEGLPVGLYHFFIVAFDAAPGVTYLDQLAEAYRFFQPQLGDDALRTIVEIFTTKTQFTDVYPESLTNRALAEELVSRIVKGSATDAAKLQAVTDIEGALGLGWTRGKVIFTVFGNLANKPFNDPTWGGTAQQFDKQIAVAKVYSEVLLQSTTHLQTLRDVLAPVTPTTDVGTEAKIVELIGNALLAGDGV